MSENRREQIINIVKNEFIGPDPVNKPKFMQENGEEIIYSDKPDTRYIAGVLFPLDSSSDDIAESGPVEILEEKASDLEWSDIDDVEQRNQSSSGYAETDSDLLDDEVINQSNSQKPSAFSFTCSIRQNDSVSVKLLSAFYSEQQYTADNGKQRNRYLRHPIEWEANGIKLPSEKNRYYQIKTSVNGLEMGITFRMDNGDSSIFTFSVLNTLHVSQKTEFYKNMFFQTEFSVISEHGFVPLPKPKYIGNDEDIMSNQLLYRNIFNYAIGHGCSVDWDNEKQVNWISTSVFPTVEIKQIVPSSFSNINLEMKQMSNPAELSKSIDELKKLCDEYEKWIDQIDAASLSLEEQYQRPAKVNIANCRGCLTRMRNGLTLLNENQQVQMAFQLMNKAMLLQQLHYNLPLQSWRVTDEGKLYLDDAVTILPDIENDNTWCGSKSRYNHWRPFQIAFILMNLKSMNNELCEERELVDLIWFPTGGGKTEAYLGLSAYTIFLRRLKNRNDSGTSIIMRYTLRLLTAQQYQRAASMICACEIIRKEYKSLLGDDQISIGLWVGSGTTPNFMNEAVKQYDELYKRPSQDNPFVVHKCPWCGAEMTFINSKTSTYSPGYKKIPLKNKKNKLAFVCGNSANHCAFSSLANPLPLYIIDESIYEKRPTLIIGTVDKFATLPNRPEARGIFGFDENGVKNTAPNLIIQDELHLISGPLGSMVGLYETMIHELCVNKSADGKVYYPKIIGSTATISHAKEQCSALYGCRKDQVIQFPPSGIDAGNSFFAKEADNPASKGRKYVGILANGSSSDAITAVYLYSSLLYGAKAIDVQNEEERDPYWTIMGYYNSIRELGTAETWIHDDISYHLDTIYRRKEYKDDFADDEEYRKSRRYIIRSEELTSRIQSTKITDSLASLEIKHSEFAYPRAIDICMATNMISVGLDVQRLGLMVMNGQPKTTSEYIQATSRVGRDAYNAPGLVFTVFNPGKPRDKSHYEQFKYYHQTIYGNVEPTSVTPFSTPARKRALHAIMFAIIRLEGGEQVSGAEPIVPEENVLNRLREVIKTRVLAVEPKELENTLKQFDHIIQEWRDYQPVLWYAKKMHNSGYAPELPLMFPAGSTPNNEWDNRAHKTPNSMRNVDAECQVTQLTSDYIEE